MYLLECGLSELQISALRAAPWRPGILIVCASLKVFRTKQEKKKEKGGENSYTDHSEYVSDFHITIPCVFGLSHHYECSLREEMAWIQIHTDRPLTVWPWTSYLPFLNLMCQMGIMLSPKIQ